MAGHEPSPRPEGDGRLDVLYDCMIWETCILRKGATNSRSLDDLSWREHFRTE